MRQPRLRNLLACLLLPLGGAFALQAWAGGSGLNTVVIVNLNSPQSCELGNYFCERRQVPPENLLRITWGGGNISWSGEDFQTNLVTPLLTMLAARQLTNQIDYVVLCMDIPFQTVNGTKINSTTSALFYGLKNDTGPNWMDVTNSYAASEHIFRQARPSSAPGYSFLASMITAASLAEAKQLVDQGVTSDRTCPKAPIILAKSSDPQRNLRYRAFDNTIFNCRLLGDYSVIRTNADSPTGQTNLFGYQTGLASFSVSPRTFVAGAMADSLTSFGGVIFGPNSQTSLLAFISAGAAGSYGTVTEPSGSTQKFPDPQDYFYQSRGFSLAESYYQALFAPYQGLVVGEPLAAPFARLASAHWTGVASNAVLSGTASLGFTAQASDPDHPVQQVDLFIDGRFLQTLTNLAPRPGNLLSVRLNGYPINYTVPTNATLASVASGLAALLKAPATTNLTGITGFLYGDRIELRALAPNGQATPFFLVPPGATNTSVHYRAQYLPDALPPQVSSFGRGGNGTFRMHIETPSATGYVVEGTTNFATWVPVFTNLTGGPLDFEDGDAPRYSRRFYRISRGPARSRPHLVPLGLSADGGLKLRAESRSLAAYAIQASTNLTDWTFISTNLAGTTELVDAAGVGLARRFYRALVLPPGLSVVNSAGGTLLRVDGAAEPFIVSQSTDLVHWTPVLTNAAVEAVQATAGSSLGSADVRTTFLSASHNTFLNSIAHGLRGFNLTGTPALGTWLRLDAAMTSGSQVSLTITNQSGNASLFDLAHQLVIAINSLPGLQGNDGLAAEDLSSGAFGTVGLNLIARGTGGAAAGIRAQLSASAGVSAYPSGQVRLDVNQADLQPRNHFYLTVGATNLACTFPLDTRTLADGFHELTAVAYEGSHVRTQTRVTIPVRIQNSTLSASLNPLDFADTAPVQGTYHIQVAANTNAVSTISLFSTGGWLAAITNLSTATFTVSGSALGAGLHPFYAYVQTPSGAQYRTATRWVRFLSQP